jgi:hypothetical protein
LSGAISGFHSGDAIEVEGLAYISGSSTVSWTQKTSGATASGVLTVKEGTQTQSFTLVGSYTSGNFSVTSDGHGGTLITDPPVTSGGSVATSADTGSSSSSVDTAPSSAGSVISGGYELGASGGTAGDSNSGGNAAGVFFSGGGMVQLDALLSQFAGVISGFDLVNEVDLQSLGFDSPSSAAPWTPQTTSGNGAAGVEGGGQIFNLTLLGQYAANFSAGPDGHGDAMITEPAASASVPPTALVVPHS